ncbi:MAG: hypothetical protein HY472_01790 [Candidatus Sungbacteria bacterium]|nr:hypothetical protein [Candidatus Sungbacteria bacterium]
MDPMMHKEGMMHEGMMKEGMMKHKMTCGCTHHKVVPWAIILIGLTFLLGAFDVLTQQAVNVVWPILLIIAGGTKLAQHTCACC